MFKKKDTKLLVENWRKFISESEENQSKAKEIKKFFYDEEFKKYMRENKSVIENAIEVINTEFTKQEPRNMNDFAKNNIIPKLKESINTLLNNFKQKYAEALDDNNSEVKMKRMPGDLDSEFIYECLNEFSFIANSNKEIHEDLQQSFASVARLGLEYKSPY